MESRPRLGADRRGTCRRGAAHRGPRRRRGRLFVLSLCLGADPQGEAVAEARVKVVSGSSFLIVSNGVGGERLGLWPDRIELFHKRDLQYKMDTTGEFHLYRMELKGPDLKVYVDGELRIDAPGAMGPRGAYATSDIAFGAANSGMMGEACWDHVQARATGLVCRDLVVSVSFVRE